MTVSTLMLDDQDDVLLAEHDDGAETLGVAVGAATVIQAAHIALNLKRGSVWWNLSAGIDYEGLFYQTARSDVEMAPIRATAFRTALLSVPGVTGFAEETEISFERTSDQTLSATVPCITIDCEDVRTSYTLGILSV